MIKKTGFIEVKVGSKKIAFKFGMGAFALFTELSNIPLSKMGDALNENSPTQLSALIKLLYAAAYQGQLSMKRDVEFTENDVANWLDEMDEITFSEIMDTMGKARIMGKGINQIDQKKTQKMK